MITFLINNWFSFLLIFISCVTFLPLSFISNFGLVLKNSGGVSFVIFTIFLMSGIMLNAKDVKNGIKNIKGTFLALLIIFVASPFLALLIIFIIPQIDIGIKIGIFILAVMPTTLSTGVVMTQVAGGNSAHSLLITSIANFLSVFTIPFILTFLLTFSNHSVFISLDEIFMMKKLLLLVFVPIFLGIFLRFLSKNFFAKKGNCLSLINQFLVLTMVFMAVSVSKSIFENFASEIFLITIITMIFHIMLLCLAFFLCAVFKVEKKEKISVIFMGSQKTLPLSIVILFSYFPQYGIAVFVCVIHHILHLLIDSFLIRKFKN